MNAETPCEANEILISALLDDELDQRDRIEAIDHLVRCSGCREFYRRARALDGLSRAVAAEAIAPPVPDHLWDGVERAAAPASRRRVATWALRAAALVVVALGLAYALSPDGPAAARMPEVIEVELGSRSGEMDEARFFEIAREVLESDQRYQRAMYEVMEEVLETVPASEGGGEEREGEPAGERARGRA